MIISREVDINVNRYGLRVVIPVVQYDSGRQIIFNIVDAELPSGCTSNIFIKKPSGKSVYNTCTVSGNKVTVTLTNQSLSEYGFNDAQIQIIKGEEVVTSFSFILEVKQSDADNAVISKSESTFFQGLVSKAQAAAKTCTDVLNSIPDDYSQMSTKVNTNTTAIATLNRKKALNLDKETSSIYSGDLNDLIETGSWLLTSNNANRPVQNQWLALVVFRSYKDSNGEVVTQFAYGRDDKTLYARMKSGNTWIEWTKIPSRAEVDALNSGLLKFLPNVADRISSFPTEKITTDVDYLVNEADATFPEKYGRLCIRRTDNNNDLIAIFFPWNKDGHEAVYKRMFISGVWTSWEKQPTRAEIDANKTAIAANTALINAVKTDLLGGYKLVGYTASVVLNKAGEFIIPYPSGESFGTVYGILSATFLQGGYCLPNPPLTPSSTSPAYDISAAVAFRLLSTGIAIYTGGAWGADSRDIYFVLICKA